MKNKFILLDRDGVINVEKNYLHKIEDFEYEKNVISGLLKLKNLGYKFAVITNQAGIAKGFYSEEDLQKNGIKIEKSYFCPHHPDGIGKYKKNCECRKPNTKNFELAIKEFEIDEKNSFMIGDRVTDLIPAQKLGMKTALVKTGYGVKNISKLKENGLDSIVVDDILEFANLIEKGAIK